MKKANNPFVKIRTILWIFLSFSTIIHAQNTSIPDVHFEQALIDLGYDTAPTNGMVPTANINTITNLDVTGKSIADLTGIEDFTKLLNLTCDDNKLTNLDLSKNIELGSLRCRNNQIKILDLTENKEMLFLFCEDNQLTTLDISQCDDIQWIDCWDNDLTSISVNNKPDLRAIQAFNNELKNLDLTGTTDLEFIQVGNNQISTIDVTKNPKLKNFRIYSNNLTSLDVIQNTDLEILNCSSNKLTQLDVTENIELTGLNVSFNAISGALDVTNNKKLQRLWCHQNEITELNVQNLPNLELLNCIFNQISELDVTGSPKLVSFWLHVNKISKLDISKNTLLEDFSTGGNNIDSLDLRTNTALIKVAAQGMPQLKYFNIRNGSNNNITKFQANGTLSNLDCIIVDDKTYSESNWRGETNASILFVESQEECSELLSVEDFAIDGFKLYPNPVRDQLTISGKNMIVNEVNIYDHTGRMVKSVRWEGKSTSLTNLSPGMYIIRIKTDQGTTARKMLKI